MKFVVLNSLHDFVMTWYRCWTLHYRWKHIEKNAIRNHLHFYGFKCGKIRQCSLLSTIALTMTVHHCCHTESEERQWLVFCIQLLDSSHELTNTEPGKQQTPWTVSHQMMQGSTCKSYEKSKKTSPSRHFNALNYTWNLLSEAAWTARVGFTGKVLLAGRHQKFHTWFLHTKVLMCD